MTKKFFLTTAIDYPNSRPHIGTAFEKIGADVQARYRRMEGYDVHFLMGNDENTVKVSRRAAELARETKEYCDDMARQFQEIWRALDISFDDFIQTSEPRHHAGCQKFIQKVYDAGHIYKGHYEGLYCEGCESFKTRKEVDEAGGVCPDHKVPPVLRKEPCYYFALSKFRDQLLEFYARNPQFIQPESRRNEIVTLVEKELLDVNITRTSQKWGIPVPFDPEYTIYVWFDALLNYITAIGYGADDARFQKWWPADMHFIGKDITRFHCALWPAMLMAAEVATPILVFGHGFITVDGQKMSKTLGNIIEPNEVMAKVGVDGYRYYFMRECPFHGDGDFSWDRLTQLYNADLANNLGNLYSRVVTLVTPAKNYGGVLQGTAQLQPEEVQPELKTIVLQIQQHVEACQYNQALDKIWRFLNDPANQYADRHEPWKKVKTDKDAAKVVLFALLEQLRRVSILLKPFMPRASETIYRSFNFTQPWEQVRYQDVYERPAQTEDVRVAAALEGGKPKPLFPRMA